MGTQRIRIRTAIARENSPTLGAHTVVDIVHDDGRCDPLPDVIAAHWWVDSRSGTCQAILLVRASVDAEATSEVFEARASEMSRLIARLQEEKSEHQRSQDECLGLANRNAQLQELVEELKERLVKTRLVPF